MSQEQMIEQVVEQVEEYVQHLPRSAALTFTEQLVLSLQNTAEVIKEEIAAQEEAY